MPVYEVHDEVTQNTLRLEGDSPPTQAELEQIFSQDSLNKIFQPGKPQAQLQRTEVERRRSDLSSEGFPAARGGWRVPVASAGETLEDAGLSGLSEPFKKIPRIDANDPKFVAAVAGAMGQPPSQEALTSVAAIINSGSGLVEGVESPVGIAALAAGPFGKVAQRLIAAGFAVDMASGVPAAARVAGEASVTGTEQQKKEAYLGLATSIGMPALLGAHALAPETTKAAGVKPFQGPPAMGTMLKTPEGAAPPAAETLAPLTTEAAKETGGEHAVQERGPETLLVAAPPEGSQEVVQGTPRPEEPAVPQAKGQEVTVADAEKLIRDEGKASVSLIQRRFKLGYTKAAALMDQLEQKGVIGPLKPEGAPRDILPPKAEVTPAIQTPEGRVVTGEDHVAAYEKAKATGTPDTSGSQEGFTDETGKFISREAAAEKTGLPTQTEPGKLHSSDLPSAAKKPKTLAERAAEEEKKPRVIFDPAIQLAEGQTVTGETHTEIRRGIDKSRLQGSKPGYVDRNTGKFYTLTEAARLQTSGTVIIEPRFFEKGPTTPAPDTSAILAKFQKVAKNKGVAAADRSKLGQLLETARKTGDVKAWQDLQSEVERVAKTVEPPPKAKRKFAIGARSDARTDILDAIQELGGMKPPGKDAGGEYDAWKETMKGTARLLINRSAKHSPDTIINELKDVGMGRIQTPDQLYDAIKNAVAEREKLRTKGGPEEQKSEDFWKAATAPGSTSGLEKVKVDDLQVGNKFRLRFPGASHEELEVTAIDPENYTVTVKDGPSFGTQDLPAGTEIWVQKEKPGTVAPPKLRPGEKVGDMFQGEDQPFNLAGETGTDAERIAREKAKAEKTEAEAAEIEKKAQPGLPGTEGGPELKGLGAALLGEVENPNSIISNMFAAIDRDRAQMGKPPMPETKKRSWDEDNQKALARMNRDPEWIPNLIQDVLERPRPLLSWENAGLVWHRAKLKAEQNNALSRLAQAFDDGRMDDLNEAKVDVARFDDKLDELDRAVGRGGTGSEAGRTLQAQKMGTGEDFSLVEMRLQRRGAKGGAPLTDQEEAHIAQLHKDYQEKLATLQKTLAESEQRASDLAAKSALLEVEIQQAKTRLPDVIVKAAERIVSQLDSKADAARARIKARMSRMSAGVDPAVILDLAEIGASHIAHIGLDFAKWSVKMIEDVGEWAKPHLKDVWEASQQAISKINAPEPVKRVITKADKSAAVEAQAETETKIAAKVEKGETGSLTPLVKKLAEQFYAQGIHKLEPMIDALQAKLQLVLPDITRLETKDALSGRGKFSLPNQDVIKKGVRDLSAQARLSGHIEQLLQGDLALPRTGPQRDQPSPEYRRLQQKLNELSRKLGVRVTDPVSQLASAMQSAKTYTRNRIADLKAEISNRERTVKTKTSLTPDAELTKLRAELEQVKSDHEKMFGKRQVSQEQRIAIANRMLDKQIASLESDLDKGILNRPKATGTTVETPELTQKRAWLAALREYRQELRDAANPKLTPAQRALQAIKSRIATQTAEFQTRLANKDFATRPPRPRIQLDQQAITAKANLERIKNQWKQENERLLRGQRAGWQKALDAFVKWERAFKLSSPIVFGKLGAAAVTRAITTTTEEAFGAGYSKLFPGLAARAPREGGGASIPTMARALTSAFTEGMKDAWQTARHGAPDIDVIYGGKLMDKEWSNFFGRIHGMVKAPVKRAEFTLSLEKRIAHAIRNGIDPTDPLVETRLHVEALDDGYRSIFMQHGFFSDWFNMAVSSAEKSAKYPVMGEVSARAMRFLLPVVRVPMNIVSETATGVHGVFSASARLMVNAAKGTLKDLPPEVADSILRQFKKGSIGLGLVAIGYFASDSIGGYDWRQKRKPGDPKVGGFQVGGTDIPRWATHAPWFELMQIGATIHRTQDSRVSKKSYETKGVTEGMWAAGLGLLEETPFVGQMLRVDKIFEGKKQRDAYLGELLKGTLVPGMLSKIAEWTDPAEKRKPSGVMERVKMGVPGLREQVDEQ